MMTGGLDLAIDTSGNVFVTGKFQSTVQFGSDSLTAGPQQTMISSSRRLILGAIGCGLKVQIATTMGDAMGPQSRLIPQDMPMSQVPSPETLILEAQP